MHCSTHGRVGSAARSCKHQSTSLAGRVCARAAALAFASLGADAAGAEEAGPSGVSFYGLVGLDVASTKRSDATPRALAMQSAGLNGPFWVVGGREDLGGGLKSVFALESFFQTTTGAAGRLSTEPLFSRNTYVGLEGGYGRATLGRNTKLLYLSEQWINPFSTSILFSLLVMQTTQPQFGGATLGDTFWNNVLQYATPNLSGWSTIAHVGIGGLAGSNAANNLALSVKYEGGPMTAVAMAQNDGIANATTATPSPSPWATAQLAWLAGGAYDLKPVKVYGAAQGTDGFSTVGQKSLTWSSGLSWSTTPSGSVLAALAKTRVSAPGKADTRRNTATFGYDYCLSKRTDLYAVYVYGKQTGQGAGQNALR